VGRFQQVVVSQHHGVGCGPWNISNYQLAEIDGRLFVGDDPLIFYHFHSMEMLPWGLFWLGAYHITPKQQDYVYQPYFYDLKKTIEKVHEVAPGFDAGYLQVSLRNIARLIYHRQIVRLAEPRQHCEVVEN
jgi:hypothetical protein